MKILMINKFLYPRGGAETYMLGIAEALKYQGHQVAFYGMAHDENLKGDQVYTVPWTELGSAQHAIQLGKHLASHLFASQTHPRVLQKAIREFQPDLIHAHNVYHQLSPALTVGVDVPCVMTAHDYKAVCPNYQLYRDGQPCEDCLSQGPRAALGHGCVHGSRFKTALAVRESEKHHRSGTYQKAYDSMVAPSQFMKNKLVQGGMDAQRIQVIHNFATPAREIQVPGQDFLYVGRLTQPKGVAELLQAFAEMKNKTCMLTVVGSGPEEFALKQLAEELGIWHRVEWTGRVAPEQVKAYINQARAVVVPSLWYENCSMTILEALANGRPVIASDRGGNPELVRHGETGWVYSADDHSALASCMDAALSNDKLVSQMAHQAWMDARQKFNINTHLEQLLAHYDFIMKGQVSR